MYEVFCHKTCDCGGVFFWDTTMNELLRIVSLIMSFALLTACASNQRIQSDYDTSVDFSEYRTYNFSRQIETENPELPELLELQFSDAIERQMLVRGYTKADNPDVLIQVTIEVEDKSRVPKRRICPSYGDYFSRGSNSSQPYRLGSSNYQPVGGRSIMCHYTEGSITVDMIGVELKRAIWTGVSLVRIDEYDRNLILARYIFNDASMMFENYPFRVHQQVAGTN
jgi:hypothetical protein